MQIVENIITRAALTEMGRRSFGDMVKAVVDVNCGVVAIDDPLHADLEGLLLQEGSSPEDLWGISLYPDEEERFLDFFSVINLRPNGKNPSCTVQDPAIRNRIREIIGRWFA